MPLNAPDMSAMSRLLDEAMELPLSQHEAWLNGLDAKVAHLVPALRRALKERTGGASFLEGGPRLEEDDAAVARPGDLVGPYRLIREIGRGGMGAVWLADRADGSLKRQVALKLPRLAWGAGLAERMARERDIGALLAHPHIARLYDAGVDARGRPFLALEYVDGVTLDQWCRERNPSVAERLTLFLQIARAVAYAHGRLVVHRDLKPSNVIVGADGQAHLLDFGIAKLLDDGSAGNLTQEQGRVLTPHYASPEQVAGEPVTVASDVYALGVLLHELLTGRRPYDEHHTLGAIEQAILQGEPPAASSRAADRLTARKLQGELDAIVAKALRRQSQQRYATADALADDIERHLKGERVLAQPDSLGYRASKVLRRHWLGVTATACVLLAIVGGSTAAVVQAQRAVQAAERERVVKDFIAEVFRADGRARIGASGAGTGLTSSLEGGAQLIETRFKGHPELQAEMYGVFATVFLDMGTWTQAVNYARREVDAMKAVAAEPAEREQALLRLARALFEDGRYGEAVQMLEPLVPRTGPLRTDDEAPVLLARTMLASAEIAELDPLLKRMDAAVAQSGDRPSSMKAWALAIRTALNQDQIEGTVSRFEAAIRIALEADGSHSMTAVEIRLLAAFHLFRSDDADTSEPFFEAAERELLTRGGAHANRAALERGFYRWQRARLGKGDPELALRAVGQSRSELIASSVRPPTEIFALLDYWSTSLSALLGDSAALGPMQEAAKRLIEHPQSRVGRYSITMFTGETLSNAGRNAEAAAWLKSALDIKVKSEGQHVPLISWIYIPIAYNELMRGDPKTALSVLDEADAALSDTSADARFVTFARDALAGTRAKVLLAQGKAAQAVAAVEPRIVVGNPSTDPWRLNVDLMYMGDPYGEALCRTGRREEGLRQLEAAAGRWAEMTDSERSGLNRVRAVAGICAFGLGRVDQARQMAALAREGFARWPYATAYHRAPLIELEALLAGRDIVSRPSNGR